MRTYGDVREDGKIFQGYHQRVGVDGAPKLYERWASPEALARRRASRWDVERKYRARRDADPERRAAARKYAAEHSVKTRAAKIVTRLFLAAKTRAARSCLPFTITKADVVVPLVCPVLGIPIEVGRGCTQPGSPSIDRINNHRGYEPGNIAVISHRANVLKRDATLEELERIVAYVRSGNQRAEQLLGAGLEAVAVTEPG